jgi:hypothetical protein
MFNRWHDTLVRRLQRTGGNAELEHEERQEEILNLVEQGKMEAMWLRRRWR